MVGEDLGAERGRGRRERGGEEREVGGQVREGDEGGGGGEDRGGGAEGEVCEGALECAEDGWRGTDLGESLWE